LRACDDRLCEQCYEDNERALRALRAPDNGSSHVVNNGENNARNSTTAINNTDTVKPCKKPTSNEHLRMSDECSDSDDDNICSLCMSAGNDSERCLKCNICASLVHIGCLSLPAESHDVIIRYASTIGYACEDCRTMMKTSRYKMQTIIDNLTAELTKLRSDVDKLIISQSELNTEAEGEVGKSKTNGPAPVITATPTMDLQPITDRIPLDIHRELKDVERRKKNVILAGLTEAEEDGSSTDNNKSDATVSRQLCEDYLQCKPMVMSCSRIGKRVPGKPRRLLVHLREESTASDLLKSARWLRSAEDPVVARPVYINPDLTPAAAKLAFEDREKRRLKRLNKPGPTVTAQSTQSNDSNGTGSQLNPEASPFRM